MLLNQRQLNTRPGGCTVGWAPKSHTDSKARKRVKPSVQDSGKYLLGLDCRQKLESTGICEQALFW